MTYTIVWEFIAKTGVVKNMIKYNLYNIHLVIISFVFLLSCGCPQRFEVCDVYYKKSNSFVVSGFRTLSPVKKIEVYICSMTCFRSDSLRLQLLYTLAHEGEIVVPYLVDHAIRYPLHSDLVLEVFRTMKKKKYYDFSDFQPANIKRLKQEKQKIDDEEIQWLMDSLIEYLELQRPSQSPQDPPLKTISKSKIPTHL